MHNVYILYQAEQNIRIFCWEIIQKVKSTNVRILGARVNQFHSIGVLRTCLLFLQHISVSCADIDQSIDILVGG